MSQKKYNIGVLTPPIEAAGIIPLSNLMGILESISDDLYLITGGAGFDYFKHNKRMSAYENNYSSGNTTFTRIVNFILFQINESRKILELSNKIDHWFFFFYAEFQLFPIIMARLCRKKVYIIITGSSIKTLETNRDFLSVGLRCLKFVTCSFAKKIVLYSNKLTEDYDFERWNEKILIAHRHFVDFKTFKIITPLSNRPLCIAYIGRLSEEKGINNLIQALPCILNDQKDLRVIIIGEGPLRDGIEDYLQKKKITDRVDLLGWISHNDLPHYLNQLQLLVLPSYTEGLPNILLEAMACGTPVLATPVGAIPDIISDGVTGFIIDDNSPECITRNVMEALVSPDLEMIAERGSRFVKAEYTFERIVERWKEIFKDL